MCIRRRRGGHPLVRWRAHEYVYLPSYAYAYGACGALADLKRADALDYFWVHPTRGELFVSGNLTRLAQHAEARVYLWLRLVPGVGLLDQAPFHTVEVRSASSPLPSACYLLPSAFCLLSADSCASALSRIL